jgi:GGDEF domain-containing protein
MRTLKIYLVSLLIYLTFVFNLERLEWKAGVDGVGVHTFVYMLVIIAITIIIFLSHNHQYSIFIYLFSWSFAYFALRLTIFNDAPIFGGVDTYVTITELAILLVAIFIANQCAIQLHKFESFIDEVYLPARERRIRQAQTAKDEINTEFIRSRRHQHPLSLVALSPDVKTSGSGIKIAVDEIQRHMVNRFITASVAKIITTEARRTDMIISQNNDDNLFYVLCPETKGDDSIALAERIRDAAREHLGISINYGIASFPDEALTYEELAKRAEQHLHLNYEQVKTIESTQSTKQDTENS